MTRVIISWGNHKHLVNISQLDYIFADVNLFLSHTRFSVVWPVTVWPKSIFPTSSLWRSKHFHPRSSPNATRNARVWDKWIWWATIARRIGDLSCTNFAEVTGCFESLPCKRFGGWPRVLVQRDRFSWSHYILPWVSCVLVFVRE